MTVMRTRCASALLWRDGVGKIPSSDSKSKLIVDSFGRLSRALADIVHGLARAEDLWRPHVLHDPDERARVRLLSTPAYEVWLLGWTPGQSVGLHDHGGANAAFCVVDGALTETAAADPNAPLGRALIERSVNAGQAGVVEAGHVHDIANRSAQAWREGLQRVSPHDLDGDYRAWVRPTTR